MGLELADIDVDDRRARLQAVWSVRWGGVSREDFGLDLDTGSAFALLLPKAKFPDVWESGTLIAPVRTLGGKMRARQLDGVLSLFDGRFRVPIDITVADITSESALLGLPVLRRFDLLLRGPQPDQLRRPVLAYPQGLQIR